MGSFLASHLCPSSMLIPPRWDSLYLLNLKPSFSKKSLKVCMRMTDDGWRIGRDRVGRVPLNFLMEEVLKGGSSLQGMVFADLTGLEKEGSESKTFQLVEGPELCLVLVLIMGMATVCRAQPCSWKC